MVRSGIGDQFGQDCSDSHSKIESVKVKWMSNEGPPPFTHAAFQGHFGMARRDITPPVGIYARNWGAAQHDVAESIHRRLTLTALSIRSNPGDPPLFYVDADLGWWKTPQTYEKFSERLLSTLGIDSSRLIFALSHTHSGPPLMEVDESLPGSAPLQQWHEELFEATVSAIQSASSETFVANLEWHHGRCGLATHRDLIDPDAEANRLVCGYHPDGPTDDTLLVGRLTDLSGKLRATLTNYACHPTTLAWDNRAISPDYLGSMRTTIEEQTDAPSLFMLGACGELAPRYQYVDDVEVADDHGRELAFATLSTLNGMEPPATQLVYGGTVESGATLAVWNREPRVASSELRIFQTSVQLPIKDWPSAEELESQRLACTDRALSERLLRKRDIRRSLGDQATFPLQIWTWRLGDMILIGTCCEAYSWLQQELRRTFPNLTLVCMNLINGSLGYLPPAELYDVNVYPVWQTPFDRGCLELTLQAMIEAIEHVVSQ
jgi:hypothetical protein